MSESRRLRVQSRLRAGVIVVSLVLVPALAAGCGASAKTGSSSPGSSPTVDPVTAAALANLASPSPTPAFRWSDVLGIRYKVAGWLQNQGSESFGTGRVAAISYAGKDPAGRKGGAFLLVAVQRGSSQPAIDDMIYTLDSHPEVLKLRLPQNMVGGAVVKVIRRATSITVGHGWPAASATYTVTSTRKAGRLFGQQTTTAEYVMFVRGGRWYQIVFGAAPAAEFARCRGDFATTLKTIKPMQ
jgi:hypothetical protein